MNTGYIGTIKPHLFYNRGKQCWACFHFGQGYVYGDTMRDAYLHWSALAGLIDSVGD